jgi:glycolate oxidase FAD binding subunit
MRSEAEPRPRDASPPTAPLPARSIDGLTPAETVTPTSPPEVAEVLAEAAARGLAVAPVGGGTALALGNPPERLDLILSTARLGGVIDYEPTDLVLSVGAGARLGDVQAVLAEHLQTLPIDPPGGDEATIGGLIATALAGPRRLSAGSLRDLLIGIAVAHPSGTVTKAGGMVVKNVTGFDLPRLYHGSLGTLGVVVSANFKVLPLPRAEATLLAPTPTLATALAAAGRIRSSRIEPAALEVAWRDGQWWTAVRLAGREETVRLLTEEISAVVGDGEMLSGTDSADWWRGYVADQRLSVADDEALLRCSVRPRLTADLAHGLVAIAAEAGAELRLLAASVGLGSVIARLAFAGQDAAQRLALTRDRLVGLADHVVVLAAPPAWKRGFDVWGPSPDALDVMRVLKEQFDPGRVLNPGRFAGFI